MNEIETFQHYQVLRREDGSLWELGRGAMGVTYKAFDVNLRCPVALKVINTAYLDHPVARQRFIREARAAAQLRHRNIASVYHLGMDAQSFFYAMEYIDGETLDSLVRRTGPLSAGVALRIALQTTRALNAASRRRLLHRDIKPTNLMIVDEDEEAEGEGHLVVKVIDFGLARSIVHGDVSTHLTVSGFVGTPQYASPEQLEEKDLDVRSDIYSLGVTLWFLLAGRPPFMGTLTNLVAQHLTKLPPWPQLENVPEPVRALLERMLQKDPALRPQSPGELRREIETCLKTITAGDDPAAASAELEADDLRLCETVASNRAHRGEDLGVGTLIANRFQLTRLMGEGNAGRVYQAQDILAGNGRLVAIKVFNRESIATPQDYEALAADVAKVREARHPNLLEVSSLERSAEHACVVMEWGGGVTLVDVLRSRGVITVGEALMLLKQAAIAADHAMAHDLRRLELGLHQVMLTSTEGGAQETDGNAIGALLAVKSPALALKIDALSTVRDPGDLATWAGKITLIPQPLLSRDTRSSIDGLIESTYTHALGLLFYELINGAPPTGDAESAGEVKYLALPMLGDAGNAILRRALSANPEFPTNGAFFGKLARALGFDPSDLEPLPAFTKKTLGAPQTTWATSFAPIGPTVNLGGLAGPSPIFPSKTPQIAALDSGGHSAQSPAELSQSSDTKAQTASIPGVVHLTKAGGLGQENSGSSWPLAAVRQKKSLGLAAIILVAMIGAGLTIWKHRLAKDAAQPLTSIPFAAPIQSAQVAISPQATVPSDPDAGVRQNGQVDQRVDLDEAEIALASRSLWMGGVNPGFLETPYFEENAFGSATKFGDQRSSAWPQVNGLSGLRVWALNAMMPNSGGLLLDNEVIRTDAEKSSGSPPPAKNASQKRQSVQTRARNSARRPAPAPNFWQKLFGAKPAPRRSK